MPDQNLQRILRSIVGEKIASVHVVQEDDEDEVLDIELEDGRTIHLTGQADDGPGRITADIFPAGGKAEY